MPHKSHGKLVLDLVKKHRVHASDKQRVVEAFYEGLDTPISLSCYLLSKYNENDQLVSKEVVPSNYNCAEQFHLDLSAVSFLRKSETLKTSFKKESAALQTFESGELQCLDTNRRLKSYLQGKTFCPDEWLLNATIRKIDRILGQFSIDDVLDNAKWGPGVTQTIKGCDTSGPTKFDGDSDITRDAYALYGEILNKAYPLWEPCKEPSFKVGCVILTVPKNAKTDRTIAVEPGINSWIQLGIGKSIRRRLRFAGYNLNSDLKNQRGAYIGSIDDSLATIDFKAASDTIAKKVVELLLPPKWFSALNAARSHMFTLKGISRFSEKFSTMGNGFTFELESLIFLAMGLAVCEKLGVDDSGVSIFGDDLILPSECVQQFTVFSNFLGFTLNPEKSFSQGPFRESCGSYYFNGRDVKPLFFKKDLIRVKDVYRLANAIRHLSHRYNDFCGCDSRLRCVWSLLVHLLPAAVRLFGPVSSGDSTIHQNIGDVVVRRHPAGWCGFIHAGLPEAVVGTEKSSLGVLLSRLHQPSRDRPYGNTISLRARTRTVYKKTMFVHLWYELGPWL